MFARTKRTSTTFVAVLAAFWAYKTVAVPLIEPKQTAKRVAAVPPEERDKIAQQQQNRLGGYARFFPPGSWELGNPNVIDGDTSKLVVQLNMPSKPSRQLDIQRCTFIGFPDGEAEEADSHRRVIIMQIPDGGVLEFEDEVDISGGKLSQLKGAVFRGPITIRGPATQPDGSDELYVTTHDAKLVDNVISTPSEVDFRFGPNSGHGRNMRIEMLPAATSPGSKHMGPNFGGIQTFELTYDVTMHLQPKSAGMMPGDRGGAGGGQMIASMPMNGGIAKRGQPQPPVNIRSDGPFQFDLVSNIATFRDGVDLTRPSPTGMGPDDRLRNCDLLTIFFQPRENKPGDAKKDTSAGQNAQKTGMPALEVRRFEAKGNPVIVDAPSNALETRSQRLEYDALTGRMVLDTQVAGDQVHLKQQTSEVEAHSLMYEPGPNGALLGVAESQGPGWLNVAAGSDVSRRFEARWKDELKMLPDGENRCISLLGDASARYAGQTEIAADALHVWLHETPPETDQKNGGPRIGGGGHGATQIQPVKMLAESLPASAGAVAVLPAAGSEANGSNANARVRIESPQFSGIVEKMEVWFRDGAVANDGSVAQPVGMFGKGGSAQTGIGRWDFGAAPTSGAVDAGVNPNANAASSSPSHYEIRRAKVLQAWVLTTPQNTQSQHTIAGGAGNDRGTLNGSSFQLEHLDIQGDVWIAETKPGADGAKPLEILGDRVQVLRANLPDTEMAVVGRPAQVGARGMTMYGPAVQLDCGANRMWIDGAGRMTIVGNPTQEVQAGAKPQAAGDDLISTRGTTVVDWKGNMLFDGKTARFQRDVVAQQIDADRTQTIHTAVMDVVMQERVVFNELRQKGAQHVMPPIELMQCQGDVLLEGREMKDGKPASLDQMQIRNLVVNRLTGDLTGDGPGRVLGWSLGKVGVDGKSEVGSPVGTASGRGVRDAGVRPVSAGMNPPGDDFDQAGRERINFIDVQFVRRDGEC